MNKLSARFAVLRLTFVFLPTMVVNAMDPGEPAATQAALEEEQEKDASTAPKKSGTETDIELLTQKMEQQVEEYRREIRECQMEAMRTDFHDILTEQSQILAIDPQSFTTLKRGLIEKYIEIKLQHDELIEKAKNVN